MLDPQMKHITSVSMEFDDENGIVSWHFANDGKMFAWVFLADIIGARVEHETGDNNYHRTLIIITNSDTYRIKYRDNISHPGVMHHSFADLDELTEEVIKARKRGG